MAPHSRITKTFSLPLSSSTLNTPPPPLGPHVSVFSIGPNLSFFCDSARGDLPKVHLRHPRLRQKRLGRQGSNYRTPPPPHSPHYPSLIPSLPLPPSLPPFLSSSLPFSHAPFSHHHVGSVLSPSYHPPLINSPITLSPYHSLSSSRPRKRRWQRLITLLSPSSYHFSYHPITIPLPI